MATPSAFPDKPFVGMPGSEKTVEISRESDRIVCRLAPHTLLFTEIVVFLFGLIAAYASWNFWAPGGAGTKAPLVFRIVISCFTLLIWFIFFRNLLGTPRIEILLSSGDLLFFNRRSTEPSFTMHRTDITGLALSQQFYGEMGKRHWPNFVVSVETREGKQRALCASPDEKLMQSFATDLASVLGVKWKDISKPWS